jgi:hypothetical protein
MMQGSDDWVPLSEAARELGLSVNSSTMRWESAGTASPTTMCDAE